MEELNQSIGKGGMVGYMGMKYGYKASHGDEMEPAKQRYDLYDISFH